MITLIIVEVLLFGFFLASDLVSKHFVMPFLEANGDYILIDKVITLTPAYNTGAGFSMLAGKTGWLIAITVVGLVLLLVFTVGAHIFFDTKKKNTKLALVSMIMMLAGGVGNLVDRIAFGHVRDFIDYTLTETLFHRSFAICNVADVWLTVGMILLIVYLIFFYRGSEKVAASEPDGWQVETAERLLAMDKVRDIDPKQVVFKQEESDAVTEDAGREEDARSDASIDVVDVDTDRSQATDGDQVVESSAAGGADPHGDTEE